MRPPSISGTVGIGLVAVAILLSLAPWTAAGAHTDLLQGSPGPAQRVGGTVDFVDLVFVDEVSDAVITLEDPNGQMIDGTTVVADGQILRYEMSPLTVTGRYILRFDMVSADGDQTESGYFFTYDTAGLEPVRLGEVDLPNNNGTIIAVIASVVFVLCLIGLAMIFLAKLERDRAEKTPSGL